MRGNHSVPFCGACLAAFIFRAMPFVGAVITFRRNSQALPSFLISLRALDNSHPSMHFAQSASVGARWRHLSMSSYLHRPAACMMIEAICTARPSSVSFVLAILRNPFSRSFARPGGPAFSSMLQGQAYRFGCKLPACEVLRGLQVLSPPAIPPTEARRPGGASRRIFLPSLS